MAVSRIAKISRPILTEIYPRSRLFKLLDTGRKRPVIWVSGPAGCGKTTLVSSYIDARSLPCLWYQVDPGDGDPATFFYYLGLAAKKAAPRIRKLLPLLTPEYLQGIPTFTMRYFEELYSRLNPPSPPLKKGGRGGFVIVFDNYKEVPEGSPFHEVILNALSHIPEGINVVLISRKGPPPVFIRLEANHLMDILGWNELRLTLEESAGIVRLRAKLKWPKEWVNRLHTTTDGWAAGLVLMMESVERRVIEPQALGKLTPEEIMDYFGNELFNKTDKEIQDFLLRTAFLPKMTPKMAEDLTGIPNARRILDALNRTHYFTEKRFQEEPIYQYHPLFREFLLSRANETLSREDQSILLHRAAILLENSGQTEEAVPLFRDSGRWDGMVELISKHAPLMLEQGRNRSLGEWIGSIPGEILEDNPWLLYWMGECHFPFDCQLSQFYFEKAFEKFKTKEEPAGIFLAWSGVVNSIFFDFGDFSRLDPWIAALGGLMESSGSFSSGEVGLRVASAMLLALKMRQPQHPEIESWAERVLAFSETCSNTYLKMTAQARLAYYQIRIGEFQKAMTVMNWLRHLAREKKAPPIIILRTTFLEAMHNRYSGFHERCMRAVSDGLKQSKHIGIHFLNKFFLLQGAASALNVRDLETTRDLLEKLAVSLNSLRPSETESYYLLRTREALVRGNLGEAAIYAEMAMKFAGKVGTPTSVFFCHLVKSHLLHQLRKYHEADHHLSRASDMADQIGRKLYKFLVLLGEALFAFDRGEQATGLVSLKKALAIGREGGYFCPHVDQPSGLTGLCEKALRNGIEVEYVQELIRRLNIIPERSSLHLENWPWPLKVFTLGRFAVVKDGNPIRFSRKVQRKPLALLKALIAYGGKEVREDQITDGLWPEADGDLAHLSFEAALHRLRQLIGRHEVIHHKDGCLTLDPRRCWVDAWAFESLVRQADAAWREEPEGTSIPRAAQLSQNAMEIYQGTFLPMEVLEPWTDSFRERLRSRFLHCVENLGHYWEKVGQWNKAVDCYRRGLEVDSLVEEFYQHLMAAYQRLGQLTMALSVYNRCKKILSEALGIAPSSQTEALYKSLIRERKSDEMSNG